MRTTPGLSVELSGLPSEQYWALRTTLRRFREDSGHTSEPFPASRITPGLSREDSGHNSEQSWESRGCSGDILERKMSTDAGRVGGPGVILVASRNAGASRMQVCTCTYKGDKGSTQSDTHANRQTDKMACIYAHARTEGERFYACSYAREQAGGQDGTCILGRLDARRAAQ